MKLSFGEFFTRTGWRDDLLTTNENWDYYRSFNEQVYGVPFEYDDVAENLPEYAEMMGSMVTEAKKHKDPEPDDLDDDDEDDDAADADVKYGDTDKAKDKKNHLMNFTRQQWKDHQNKIKDLFRPRRDKTGRLKNPHAGVKLVSPGDNNPKTEKGYAGKVANPHHGQKRPIKNAVMHLLPAGFSGCNTCAAHTPECAASCLDVAGNPGFMGVKTSGRARRTFMFAYNKDAAMTKLAREVDKMAGESHGAGLNFALRLNGTSDIPWESSKYAFQYNRKSSAGKKHPETRESGCPSDPDAPKTIFCHFPEVQFYDYTKLYKRALDAAEGNMPPNYHLTFSYSEKTDLNAMEELLDKGGNVAMVFAFAEKNYDPEKAAKSAKKRAANRAEKTGNDYQDPNFTADPKGRELVSKSGPYKLPKVWRGENGKTYKIISGDVHDLRFLDEKGVIVGLAAKGDAKYVQSNGRKQVFVVQPDDPHLRYEKANSDWVVSATKAHPRRMQSVEARKKQDAEFVDKLRQQAAALPDGEEKEELLDRADRIASGAVNYFGPNAQRDRSNAMYSLAKEDDPNDPDHLSPLEQLRKTFIDRAARDREARINKEIKAMELKHGPMSDKDKEAYRIAKSHEYRKSADGLPAFKQKDDLPHRVADDPGQAPNDQPSLLSLGTSRVRRTPLAQHIAQHKDDFERQYAAATAPKAKNVTAGSTATPPYKRSRVAVESTNPYLRPLLEMVS